MGCMWHEWDNYFGEKDPEATISPPTVLKIVASKLFWGIMNVVEFDSTDRLFILCLVKKIS